MRSLLIGLLLAVTLFGQNATLEQLLDRLRRDPANGTAAEEAVALGGRAEVLRIMEPALENEAANYKDHLRHMKASAISISLVHFVDPKHPQALAFLRQRALDLAGLQPLPVAALDT